MSYIQRKLNMQQPQAVHTNNQQGSDYYVVPCPTPVYSAPDDEKKEAPAKAVVSSPSVRASMSPAMRALISTKRSKSGSSNTITTRMAGLTPVSSTAANVVLNSYDIYNDATVGILNMGEWTNFSALFRQYRIRRITVHWVPYTPSKVEASVNTNGRPLVICFDPDSSAAPSSAGQLFSNQSCYVYCSQEPKTLKFQWKNEDERWFDALDSANPLVPQAAVKLAGDSSFGTSIPIGALFFEYTVEFRARL
jgi:hypothetical protein